MGQDNQRNNDQGNGPPKQQGGQNQGRQESSQGPGKQQSGQGQAGQNQPGLKGNRVGKDQSQDARKQPGQGQDDREGTIKRPGGGQQESGQKDPKRGHQGGQSDTDQGEVVDNEDSEDARKERDGQG